MDYRRQAHKMVEHKLVPVPLTNDGSKLPKIKWKQYQKRYPTPEEIEEHFEDCGGVAALTLAGDPENLTSDLFLLDFDLKYQLPHQNFFKEFGKRIPTEIKMKFLINQTGSGVGRHIWFRTRDFHDKNRKLAYRLKTPEEIMTERDALVESGLDIDIANVHVMKKPYQVVIETRGANSYGVLFHPKYKRVFGKKLHYLDKDEIEIVLNAAYETCQFFEKREKFVGEVKQYSTIQRYNEDSTPGEMMRLLSQIGLQEVSSDSGGNIMFLRSGSRAKHSGKIFGNTSVVHVFSDNTPMFDAGAYAPFDVYCIVNNLTKQQAIKELNNIN